MNKKILCSIAMIAMLFLQGQTLSQNSIEKITKRKSFYSKKPLSYWIESLKDPDSQNRIRALRAMTVLDPIPEAVIVDIVKMMGNDPDNSVKWEAGRDLETLGPKAAVGITVLTDFLRNPDVTLKRSAAGVIVKIGPAAHAAIPALKKAVQDKDEAVTIYASAALLIMDKKEYFGLENNILDALDNPNTYIRSVAISAIGEIRPDRRTLSALAKIMAEDSDGHARQEAGEALGKIGPAAVPILTKALSHPSWHVRWISALALGKIGPSAHASVPSLIEVLKKDPDSGVRRETAETLGRIDPSNKSAIVVLIKILRDPNDNVRSAAFWSLVKIGPPAIPALIEALKDKDAVNNSWNVAQILPHIIPLDLVMAMKNNLKDPTKNETQNVIDALKKIEPTAVSVYLNILNDRDTRKIAVEALENIRWGD